VTVLIEEAMSGWLHVSSNSVAGATVRARGNGADLVAEKLRALTAATAEANIQAQPRMSGNVDRAANSSGHGIFIVIRYGPPRHANRIRLLQLRA
jgi:hypothetical protein